jgi:hypothetical protein
MDFKIGDVITDGKDVVRLERGKIYWTFEDGEQEIQEHPRAILGWGVNWRLREDLKVKRIVEKYSEIPKSSNS